MEIGLAGKIAIAILLVLLLIWIMHTTYKTGYMPDGAFRDTYESMVFSTNKQYDKYFESPLNMYNKTTGHEDDDAAQIAILKALSIESAHNTNDLQGTLATTAGDAAVNAFLLGDLYQFNEANKEAADIYYRRALRRIGKHAPIVIAQEVVSTQNPPTPEHILDHIADFYDTNQLQQQQIFDELQEARDEVRYARILAAKTKKRSSILPPRTAARAAYFEDRAIRNDPQNTHDSTVTHDYKVKLDLMKRLNDTSPSLLTKDPTAKDIEDALRQSSMDDKKKARAMDVLATMVANKSGRISSLDASESEVLSHVWKRIHSVDNQSRQAILKDAFFDALSDSMERRYDGQYSKVCSTGRTERMIDSLTLSDTSERLSAPTKTSEMLRNEIFAKAHTILQTELHNASDAVQQAYAGASDENPPGMTEFKNATKKLIHDTLLTDYKDTKPEVLSNLIKDAQAGVDI